ncbi:MAG: hypothetical protein JO121_30795 [Deltaproteobacteria bacterium]|nr:hypothetical protein [Deltaproteobacteria bacterium]
MESLVAIVPDPVESSFGDVFDALIESLQRGAEAAGFVLGPFDLAWSKELVRGDQGSQNEAAPSSADGISSRRPSVLLFRDRASVPGKSHLLVMFLVGETPRSGVEMTALTVALDQAANLPRLLNELLSPRGGSAKSSQSFPEIRIMGPTFSGSASSLEFGLRDWIGARRSQSVPIPRVTVISGSATAIDKAHFLSGLDASFCATTVPVPSAQAALLKWLNLSAEDEVAVLSEGDTVYGSQLLSHHSPARPKSSPQPTERNPPTAAPKLLQFAFPLHIADLERAAKESEQNAAGNAISNPGPSLGNRSLPLAAAQQSRATGDVIPLFSSAQTNSTEVALLELLKTIHDRRIAYTIIGATDVHDIDYLAKQLQDCCAESRIITLNSDQLYLHSEVNPDLAGAIVASTYPLIGQNQRWTGASSPFSSQTYEFSSGTAEGVFNATVALLGKPERMVEYGMPFSADTKASDSQKPGLWLTVVGRGDVWPLDVLKVDDSEGYLCPKMTGGSTDLGFPPSRVFEFFFVAASVVCIVAWLLMGVMLFPSPDQTEGVLAGVRNDLPISIQVYFGESVFKTNRRARRAYLFILAGGLLVTYAILVWYYLPVFSGFRAIPDSWSRVRFASIIGIGIISTWCGSAVAGATFWLLRQPARRLSVPTKIVLIYGTLVFVVISAVEFLSARLTGAKAVFLFLRTGTLGDGVSPLVPLLWVATAGLLMLMCTLRRLNLSELRSVGAVFLNFGTDSFKVVEEFEVKVRNQLSAPLPGGMYLAPIFLVIVAAYCYAHWAVLFASFDGGLFAAAFLILSLLVYTVIGTVLLRLIITWLAIRGLLRNLYWHPSRRFYATLHEGMPGGEDSVIDMLSADPAIIALEVSLEQARVLGRYAPSQTAVPAIGGNNVAVRLATNSHLIGRLTRRAEKSQERALLTNSQGKWRESTRHRGIAEKLLARLSQKIAEIFEPVWDLDEEQPWSESGLPDGSVMVAGGTYIAARVADYLRQVLPQVSLFAFAATAGVLMMLFAVSSYPFPAQGRLVLFNWVFVFFTVGTCAFVYFSMNRDHVLSLLSGTTPGKISWNGTFLLQMFTHGVLPILAVLGAAFPTKFGLMARWIENLFGA